MNQPLEASVLRVFDETRNVIGTAFLVDDNKVITCAHVVQKALGRENDLIQSVIQVDFPLLPEKKFCFARIEEIDNELDIAGLALTSPPPDGAQSVDLLNVTENIWGHEFRTIGFPQPYGSWASGVLRAKNSKGWIQVEDTKTTGYTIQPGFSGAPIWDEKHQAVIGMLVASERDQSAKVAYCIPSGSFNNWWNIHRKIKTINPDKKINVFISYKRDQQPDEEIATYISNELTNLGCSVFIDRNISGGEDWLIRIDRELEKSDYLIVLLSETSAYSEMVKSEVFRAYDYRKKNGHPKILPIRIEFKDILPYAIAAFINPFQYIEWDRDNDFQEKFTEVWNSINGSIPFVVSEGIHPIKENENFAPLPEFDPRILSDLNDSSGTLKLSDKFYIRRDDDGQMDEEMTRQGATVTIRAPRQAGKSSLLIRGLSKAKSYGATTILLDMQRVDNDHLASLDVFLRYFSEYLFYKLSLDLDPVEKVWRKKISPQDKTTELINDFIFPNLQGGLVVGLDEIDKLLKTKFYTEFFALLRSWHNLRAIEDAWERLSVILVISTEPFLLISDIQQSPFNVGINLSLADFNLAQVQELCQRHGNPISNENTLDLYKFLGGHPYLTRKSLYLVATKKQNWESIKSLSMSESGPFGDHLKHYRWILLKDEGIKNGLLQLIKGKSCKYDIQNRLLQAGLLKDNFGKIEIRCDLYKNFFESKL